MSANDQSQALDSRLQRNKNNGDGADPSHEQNWDVDNNSKEVIWNENEKPRINYARLGKQLAKTAQIFRSTSSKGALDFVPADASKPTETINDTVQLAAFIEDHLDIKVFKNGTERGSEIANSKLKKMRKSESFLSQFPELDLITDDLQYLLNWQQTKPGYNDGGPGHRIFFRGSSPDIKKELEAITKFLDAMDFASKADRTNAVAAALTVMLRNHWPGAKPIILATATKSYAGKDTVISFASGGPQNQISISYQKKDWALERNFVGAVRTSPNASVVVVENARLDGQTSVIASAFLERFATDEEPMLFSTGTGNPQRRKNDLVVAISTNYGSVSPDLMNRSLPIHLKPVGDVASRKSPIGNPKEEFLPVNREQIQAELRGMIENWKEAGCPKAENIKHPFTEWAAIIGGILQENGFENFLANYSFRRTADDPLKDGLGILGASRPGIWLSPTSWAQAVREKGLVKTLIPTADRENEDSQARGIGKILSAHIGETMHTETENERLQLRLRKGRKRFERGKQPSTRYRFVIEEREEVPVDDDLQDEDMENEVEEVTA